MSDPSYESCAAFVTDGLAAISVYGTRDYVENRGNASFLRLVDCLRRINSAIIWPILQRAIAPDGTFIAEIAEAIDQEYYATGEDLYPLFVADAAASPGEQSLLQEDAEFSDMADRVLLEVAPAFAPDRLAGAEQEVILDYSDHLDVVERGALIRALGTILGDELTKLFGKLVEGELPERNRILQAAKRQWGGRRVKFVITGAKEYEAHNPEHKRNTDWFRFGMHGLFKGVRGVEVISRNKTA
jgi:hypothetical protein